MADRPNRPQPFRFWLPFWANPTLPPLRPPIPARWQPLPQTPASTPLPPAQPQSPSQTQPKSTPASATRAARPQPPSPLPSLTRKSSHSLSGDRKEHQPSPSRLQVPSPTVPGKASHPSQPSKLDSKGQPAIQNASTSPSKGASQPQPGAIQELSRLPSQPLPPSSQPESPIGSITHSNQSNLLPQESQPVVQTKSPTQLQPGLQIQTISQTQEMNPIQPAYMPQDNQPAQDLEAKQSSVSSLQNDFPAEIDATPSPYPSISEKEPKETNEEKPRNFLESKLDMQPSKLLKSEENSEIGSEEQPETKAEASQEKNPTENVEPGSHVEGLDEDESKTKIETQPQEPQAEASNGPEKQTEAKLSSITSDTKPTRSSLKAGDIIAELRSSKPEHSKKQENVTGNKSTKNGSSRKEGKIAISTMSCAKFNGQRAPFEKEIKEGLSRLAQDLSIGHSKRIGNGQAVSMITLAGENNGASMVIGSDTHVHRGFKHDKGNVEASSDNVDGRRNPGGNENSAITASINSNVQSINNSTMHDSSCNVRDPGIHLNLSSKKMEAANLRRQTAPLKPQKTAPSITPADQKPSHEPRIRRRCLRALFMESSESDPEKPQKPRRHGCRFNCEEKKKGKGDLDGTSTTNRNARARQVKEGTSRA
ncbi:proteoglycan 4-like [Phoenix dactylifera]|uniref:Proteoglycan 4-like n=1 Tax=Phoenix dactylifera TaxID=42345 RepID=A0A8B9AE74_PHODC|nr:proteoglycan 4-like [Phoenix dactylifera]